MSGDNNKKGFSGLSDLVSDIGDTDVPATHDTPAPSPKSTHTKSQSSDIEKKQHKPHPLSPANESGNTRAGSSGSKAKWVFGILAVILVVWFANTDGPKTKKTAYNPPVETQKRTFSNSSPPPTVPTKPKKKEGLQYEKPPVGTKNVLSVPQIRWCEREGIRIDAMRDVIESNDAVDEFNKIVDDLNRRCSSFKYRPGSLETAQKQVEEHRAQIEADAIKYAMSLGPNSQFNQASTSNTENSRNTPLRPSAKQTREAQELLKLLGYDPGPIDGQYGRRTAEAVKAFQNDNGLPQDGFISEDLLKSLRKEKNLGLPPPLDLPKNGWIVNYHSGDPIAPLRIITRDSYQNYFAKIEDYYTGQSILTVFVRGGESIDIEVPLGTYKLKYAVGKTWYGPDYLFGPETSYSKADEKFLFSRVGNNISGYTVELYLQRDGNLQVSNISASNF